MLACTLDLRRILGDCVEVGGEERSDYCTARELVIQEDQVG